MTPYLQRKASGGASGKKGSRYEDLFAAYMLAEVLAQQLNKADMEWPEIHVQLQAAYVDDLAILAAAYNHFFQLKNVQSASWHAGTHSIENDFSQQMRTISHLRNSKTILVVSDFSLFQKLQQTLPGSISSHSEVRHFPYTGGIINALILSHHALRNALSQLTRANSPTTDELEYVFGALLVSFFHTNDVSTKSLLAKAQQQTPHLVRLFPHQTKDIRIKPDFLQTLAQIPGLKHTINTGFFCWECRFDSGVLPYNCLDPQFGRFQDTVIRNNPTTFDAFEVLLPC